MVTAMIKDRLHGSSSSFMLYPTWILLYWIFGWGARSTPIRTREMVSYKKDIPIPLNLTTLFQHPLQSYCYHNIPSTKSIPNYKPP